MIAKYSVTLENKTKSELILFIKELQNMLKEKDKEIESLEKTLDEKYIFVTGARTLYAGLMSLDKENIVKDDLKLRNEIYQHIEDEEKKEKIIDLMAEYINHLSDELVQTTGRNELEFCDGSKCCKDSEYSCEQCIKQYFERKSEE